MTTQPIHIIVSAIRGEDETWWDAQCLEYDIGAQAKSPNDLMYEFQRVIAGYLATCKALGCEPFVNLEPAPQKYWDMWEKAKLHINGDTPPFRAPMPLNTVLPLTEMRLAA